MKQAHQIPAPGRQALIIGAGLAGCALAEAFSRRGWQVTVLEAGHQAGGAVASLPLIAQHPAISPDFDRRSRLLIEALCQHAALRAGPAADIQPAFEVCGRLQPMDLALAQRCAAHVPDTVARAVTGIADALGPQAAHTTSREEAAYSTPATAPSDTAIRLRSAPAGGAAGTEAAQSPGAPAATGVSGLRQGDRVASPRHAESRSSGAGLWFPGVAALSPARWWQQILKRDNIRLLTATPVERIEAVSHLPDSDPPRCPGAPAPAHEATHPARVAHAGTSHRQKPAANSPASAVNACPASQKPPRWRALRAGGMPIAEADVLILACQADAFRLAGMQEEDHGRLRFAPARVWVYTAETAPASPDPGPCPPDTPIPAQTDTPTDSTASCPRAAPAATPSVGQPWPAASMPAAGALDIARADPGSPPLAPIQSEPGLCLERPGRFWLHNDEYHRHWLAKHGGSSHQANAHHGDAEQTSSQGSSHRDDDDQYANERMASTGTDGPRWHPGPQGERLQLRDNLPMIGQAPDVDRIGVIADELARNDRLPMPRRAGLYLLTGLAGRGSLYAAIGAEMIAASACGEPAPVPADLQAATDPARFIKRRLQRAWSRRGKPDTEPD